MRNADISRVARHGLFFVALLFFPRANAQPPRYNTPAYIEEFGAMAQQQMITYRIPASVTIAQAILESHSGTSDLAKRSNNHFGIKCHTQWQGDTIVKDDDTANECFRKYEHVDHSYEDHSIFLVSRSRYASLFTLHLTDYKGWCYGLKAAGYATASAYAEDLIRIIERHELHKLDGVELLERKSYVIKTPAELKPVVSPSKHMLAWGLVKSNFLFADERDIYPPSLVMLGLSDSPEARPIAGR